MTKENILMIIPNNEKMKLLLIQEKKLMLVMKEYKIL